MINTLDVYSKSKDVFDKLKATLFGLAKAKAVPREDLLSAPISIKISMYSVENLKVNNFYKY